jgi:geranylgeranyl diphosphate synthase type II
MNDYRLTEYLSQKRAAVDAYLRAVLRPEPGLPVSLLEAMSYSLLAPGKRLRPVLAILAAEACGGTTEDALPAAAAVEMVHAYSLIHDDLPAMDDDDLRRGLPTCHKKFGEALAILAGDALLTKAFEVLAEGYPGATGASCCRDLARAAGAAGMVGGQVDDLAWEKGAEHERSAQELAHLHARKTGALIRASLCLGVRAAHSDRDPPPSLLDRFGAFGRCLGLAFQITDDLLDVEGQADRAGKRVGKDAARGKLTYPGLLGVAESRARAERLGHEAREHLAPLGLAASRLLDLVALVLERDR